MNVEFPVELSGAKSSTLMWAPEHEVGAQALQQLRNIARAAVGARGRVMPDVHLGKGATVGSVIAMRQAVSPAAVGVDIGCGMEGGHDLADGRGPAGRPGADPVADRGGRPGRFPGACGPGRGPPARARPAAAGIGSGVRFTSLHDGGAGPRGAGQAADGHSWWWQPLHRGLPRRRGPGLADAALGLAATSARNSPSGTSRIARELPHNADLPDRDLAVFLSGTPQMDAYRRDLYWAQEYASRNRAVMLALVMQAVRESFPQEVRLRAADLVPPQLRGRGAHRRARPARHPQGRDPGRARGPRADPGVDGHRVVRRPWAGLGAVLLLGLARGRPADEPQRGEAPVHGRRPGGADRGRRVPQGRRGDRRDPAARTRTSSPSSPPSPTWSRSSPTSSSSSASRAESAGVVRLRLPGVVWLPGCECPACACPSCASSSALSVQVRGPVAWKLSTRCAARRRQGRRRAAPTKSRRACARTGGSGRLAGSAGVGGRLGASNRGLPPVLTYGLVRSA